MIAALVRLSTHIKAHHLHVLNQGKTASLVEGYQRGVQGPKVQVRPVNIWGLVSVKGIELGYREEIIKLDKPILLFYVTGNIICSDIFYLIMIVTTPHHGNLLRGINRLCGVLVEGK